MRPNPGLEAGDVRDHGKLVAATVHLNRELDGVAESHDVALQRGGEAQSEGRDRRTEE